MIDSPMLAAIIRRVDGNHDLGTGALADAILGALPSGWCGHAAEIERLAKIKKAARLPRNVAVHDGAPGLKGEWVAVPKEDFDALRTALAEGSE